MEKKSILSKINDGLYRIENVLASVIFFTILVLMIIQVFVRYCLTASLAWTEEMMRFMFIMTSFIGGAAAVRTGKNVEINFLGTLFRLLFKDKPQKAEELMVISEIPVTIIGFFFCIWISKAMYGYAMDQFEQGQLSVALEMPTYWITAVITGALIAMAVHFFLNFFENIEKVRIYRKGNV